MQTKRVRVQLKAERPGALKAVFATFDVVDNDGDVTRPGAFAVGAKVPIAGVGHNWDTPTIGGGTVMADEKSAWIDGVLNLEMQSATEHWKSIKFDVDQEINRQEYSYAYDVLKGHSARPDEIKRWPGAKRVLESLAVHEVSPVLLGAGIGTGTLLVKGRKAVALSDEQRCREIAKAVIDASDRDMCYGPYVVATYPDRVLVCEDDGTFKQIAYTIDAQNVVTLGDEIEVLETWSPKARAALRELKEGRVLSTANRELIRTQLGARKTSIDEMQALLDRTGPAPKSVRYDTAILRSAHDASKAQLRRVFGMQI